MSDEDKKTKENKVKDEKGEIEGTTKVQGMNHKEYRTEEELRAADARAAKKGLERKPVLRRLSKEEIIEKYGRKEYDKAMQHQQKVISEGKKKIATAMNNALSKGTSFKDEMAKFGLKGSDIIINEDGKNKKTEEKRKEARYWHVVEYVLNKQRVPEQKIMREFSIDADELDEVINKMANRGIISEDFGSWTVNYSEDDFQDIWMESKIKEEEKKDDE